METEWETGAHRPRLQWSRSLRFRLTLWYTGLLAVILLCASLLVYLGARHALRVETDGYLLSDAHRLEAVAVGRPGDPPEESDLQEAVAAAPVGMGRHRSRHRSELLLFDVVYTRLVRSPDGEPLATSPELAQRPALLASLNPLLRGPLPDKGRFVFAGPDEERLMRVYTKPVRIGTGTGWLQAAVSWDHNADLLERLGRLLLVGVPVVLLAAALGGWTLVGRTLQPISRIVTEVERLDAAALPQALLPEASETDSEIGHLVHTLNRMTTRLHIAFEVQRQFAQAQQRFAADASHELRTPLTILRGEMELALTRPRPPQAYQATLASAVEEIARMSRIVEGLSILARRDAGRMETQAALEAVDLSETGQSVVSEFLPQARQKGIRLQSECGSPGRAIVQGNADQLQQLVRNLVDNALKYTFSGGVVTVTVTCADGDALLAVSDTGIGIAPEDLPHLFERFWRADRSRAGEGSGLGLAICEEIAAGHGGALTVTSNPGQGSRFLLRLPCQRAQGA